MRPLAILLGCFLGASGIVAAQDRGAQSRSRTRDATPTERPGLSPDNGRLGRQPKVAGEPLTWRGLLIDAGCPNRSSLNWTQPSDMNIAKSPNTSDGRRGVRVDPSVVDTERGEAMWAYHVDHLTRQMDPGCAVNGSTKGFALLVPGQKSDRLLDLDEGGNTLAWDAFQASQTGQKVLNGEAPGEKPVATVVGTAHGDRLIVKTIRLEPPRKPSK